MCECASSSARVPANCTAIICRCHGRPYEMQTASPGARRELRQCRSCECHTLQMRPPPRCASHSPDGVVKKSIYQVKHVMESDPGDKGLGSTVGMSSDGVISASVTPSRHILSQRASRHLPRARHEHRRRRPCKCHSLQMHLLQMSSPRARRDLRRCHPCERHALLASSQRTT